MYYVDTCIREATSIVVFSVCRVFNTSGSGQHNTTLEKFVLNAPKSHLAPPYAHSHVGR